MGLSTGAVIGIAVGCAIAGVVIGVIASVFLLQRHTKCASEQIVESHPRKGCTNSRALTVIPVTAVSDLDQFLLEPKSDKELAGEVQSLGYLIQQHVEDNYHLSPVRQSAGSLSQELECLGLGKGDFMVPKPAQLAAMATDPNTRFATLQHVIARVIFDSLSVKSVGSISMLPPSVSSLLSEMPPCEKHVGNPEGIVPRHFYSENLDTSSLTSLPVMSIALTRWRQITAFLLNTNRSERGVIIPRDTSLEPRARQLVGEMDKFLRAFVEENNRQQQVEHLQEVVLECANLGYSIFSQPADFTWSFGSGVGKDIVVSPGLDRVSDSQGVMCQPEMTIPPEVHRVQPVNGTGVAGRISNETQ